MKRNKLFIAGLVTVFVALCSLTLVSSTWAKYTSTASGSDTARVAKWAWEFNGSALGATQNIDLFNTVIDTKTGVAETDVATKEGEVIIAPGTRGAVTFTLKNASEVNAVYEIDFSATIPTVGGESLPIVFCKTQDGTYGAIDTLDITETELDMNATATINLYWMWAFEQNPGSPAAGDAIDKLFADGETEVTVSATITMTQVD